MTPDNRFQTTLARPTRDAVVVELQSTLTDLIDLALQAKQYHWVVVGERFQSVHELLDELTMSYREWSDDVAERCSALGVAPDGTAQFVANNTPLPRPDKGFLVDMGVADAMAHRTLLVASAIRDRASRVAELDPASEDLLLGILQGLEKQAWMLQSHTLRRHDAQKVTQTAHRPWIGAAE